MYVQQPTNLSMCSLCIKTHFSSFDFVPSKVLNITIVIFSVLIIIGLKYQFIWMDYVNYCHRITLIVQIHEVHFYKGRGQIMLVCQKIFRVSISLACTKMAKWFTMPTANLKNNSNYNTPLEVYILRRSLRLCSWSVHWSFSSNPLTMRYKMS